MSLCLLDSKVDAVLLEDVKVKELLSRSSSDRIKV